MKRLFCLIFFYFVFLINSFSQDNTNYLPKISLTLRTKVEQNLSKADLLFYVRNARFAVRGQLSELISYKAEIDWQDEDEIDMLDAVINFKPLNNLTISLGQQKHPFSNEYQKNPYEFDFANRNFINKRMCKGLRDIGILGEYKLNLGIPATFLLGLFNGNGINTLETDYSKIVSSRIDLFPFDGYRLSVSASKGKLFQDAVQLWDISTEYNNKYWHFDTEVAQKKYIDKSILFYGFYTVLAFHTYNDTKYFNKITYAIRWEMYNRDPDQDKESPRRFTAGVTFNLPSEQFQSNIRFDYEKYVYRNNTPSGEDKFTMELSIRIK